MHPIPRGMRALKRSRCSLRSLVLVSLNSTQKRAVLGKGEAIRLELEPMADRVGGRPLVEEFLAG